MNENENKNKEPYELTDGELDAVSGGWLPQEDPKNRWGHGYCPKCHTRRLLPYTGHTDCPGCRDPYKHDSYIYTKDGYIIAYRSPTENIAVHVPLWGVVTLG